MSTIPGFARAQYDYDTQEEPTIDVDAIEESSGYLTIACGGCDTRDEIVARDLASARAKMPTTVCAVCEEKWTEVRWESDNFGSFALANGRIEL